MMHIRYLFLFLSMVVFLSCDNQEAVGYTRLFPLRNRIMPLGASRVQGARPDYESFRYELWKNLVQNNWTFNFIGTQKDTVSYPVQGEAIFDPDHEGRAGYTSVKIRDGLPNWLERTPVPNIVLYSSPGGNDALAELPVEETLENIRMIIEILQARNPEVTIILEQMAPPRSDFMTPEIEAYLETLREEIPIIASEYTTETSLIVVANMYTGFKDEYLADELHYNEAGAEFIAKRYYNIFKFLLVTQITEE